MYTQIADILDQAFGAKWFLDSGSLLGVIRDGRFLEQDKGIDISILLQETYNTPTIEKAIHLFKDLGFIVSRYEWDHIAYKFCLAPLPRTQFPYAVDLHLFVETDTEFLCPQVSLKRKKRKSLRSLLRSIRKGNAISGNLLKRGISSVYRYGFRYFNQPMNMMSYVKRGVGDTYLWHIPQSMVKKTRKDKYGLNVLAEPEEYLKFRYGDWQTPVKDWKTLRDDGGIRKCTTEDISRLIKRNM